MSQDVMICVMNSTAIFDVNLEMQSSEFCVKCLDLDVELLNKENAYNDLSKSYSQLEKHCVSLELTMKLNQEIFQKDSFSVNQNALEILEYFENNDLKAQLQAKDTTICKLKEHIKSMRENDKEEKVKHDMDEIKTINIGLEHSVAKLLFENEHLHKEIEHLKKIYKDQFDSIKKTRALSKEHWKEISENATQIPNSTTIAPGMFKLDLDPLAPSLLKNRESHIDYLKHTQEQADILRGIVEQAKAKKPLDNALDFACKHAKRIQELLVYVRDTFPNAYKPSEKLVVVTPMNKVKKVRFSEPLTSSSNIYKQSRMELYIENRENRRMILELVLNGPLIWPTIVQEDGTIRKKTYAELLAIEKIQADYDLKATNIVLQGLAVPVFNQGDDPISYLNKAIDFLTVVASLSAHVNKATCFYDNTHIQSLGYQNPFYIEKAQRIKPTLYDGSVISSQHAASPVIDDEETLILEEVNFGKRFVPQQELSAEQAFWLQTSNPNNEESDISPGRIEAPSELPKIVLLSS
ncbi:hypothetical protein Tco_1283973 [Tanacetum coccineum]